VIAAASTVAAAYLRGVDGTGRWAEHFDPEVVARLARGDALIGAFWHQRTLGVPALWHRISRAAGTRQAVDAIVSEHGDGELIAQTLAKLAIGRIRGSTNRRGTRAARQAHQALAAGRSLAVVVDGPRGPHAHVHGGAVFLARLTGRPIVPLTFAVKRGVQAKSWDRMLIPLPFTHGAFHAGAPVHVAADADGDGLEAARWELAARLDALNAAADAEFGVAR